MNKLPLRMMLSVITCFLLLNIFFLFLPLFIGTYGTKQSVISTAESALETITNPVSDTVEEDNTSFEDSEESACEVCGQSLSNSDEVDEEKEEPSDQSSKLTCKIYREVDNSDYKIYEQDGVVYVEVKGAYADGAVDYLRGHGCAPLASGNIVYIVNGEEISL